MRGRDQSNEKQLVEPVGRLCQLSGGLQSFLRTSTISTYLKILGVPSRYILYVLYYSEYSTVLYVLSGVRTEYGVPR